MTRWKQRSRSFAYVRPPMTPFTRHELELLNSGKGNCLLATLRADGSPHVTPVWTSTCRDHLVISSTTSRAKVEHISRAPLVCVVVTSSENRRAYVEISGVAVVDANDGIATFQRLAQLFEGVGFAPFDGDERVTIRVYPSRIDSRELGRIRPWHAAPSQPDASGK